MRVTHPKKAQLNKTVEQQPSTIIQPDHSFPRIIEMYPNRIKSLKMYHGWFITFLRSYICLAICSCIVSCQHVTDVYRHFSRKVKSPQSMNMAARTRGGSTRLHDVFPTEGLDNVLDNEEERNSLVRYRMEQQHLYQLRSTILSEALNAKGIKVGPTLEDVTTAEADRPPQMVDWDCSLSTRRHPKTCLYSFDAEPNTKVISPIDTTQYISLRALNRLRRTDPSKVEPMWHSKYAILPSWFGEDSEYSLLQYLGLKGFIISNLLLDSRGLVLKSLILLGIFGVTLLLLPILEFIVASMLVSKPFWDKWSSWARFAHAALPLKLLMGQMAWKFLAGLFSKIESRAREALIDVECSILEEAIPITVHDKDNGKKS